MCTVCSTSSGHSHTFTCALTLTFSGAHSPTLPHHTNPCRGCKAISGNTRASCRCRHLKCSLQRAWEDAAPGAHLSEAGDRKGRVRRQEKLFTDTSAPRLLRVVDLFESAVGVTWRKHCCFRSLSYIVSNHYTVRVIAPCSDVHLRAPSSSAHGGRHLYQYVLSLRPDACLQWKEGGTQKLDV